MKKYILIVIAVLLAGGLNACGSVPGAGDDRISIVTTIFPEYDWVMNILGDASGGADVTLLLDNGVDLHSYQPTASDILKISSCDIFIYVGGESDEWVKDALKEAVNKDMVVINLLDVLGDSVREEETVEGMQEDHSEEAEEGEKEYDEHVWLSLKNAAVLTDSIAKALAGADPSNAETYSANATAYIEKLNALDAEYRDVTVNAPVKTLLFADRFPFAYMTADYGLTYYAAFAGCSAETEASFETITFLADKADELSLNAVMTIEGTDHRLAESVVNNTADKDLKILTLDSLQSVTSRDIKNGVTYLSVMEDDLNVLKEALK
ncbi:MAG: metal ABC transporter substrate-binding protein [Lachnospiraceae bacterium]|nr:metal ABC transporter substrate-binding protein [Lachnospiraceae bacterium]